MLAPYRHLASGISLSGSGVRHADGTQGHPQFRYSCLVSELRGATPGHLRRPQSRAVAGTCKVHAARPQGRRRRTAGGRHADFQLCQCASGRGQAVQGA